MYKTASLVIACLLASQDSVSASLTESKWNVLVLADDEVEGPAEQRGVGGLLSVLTPEYVITMLETFLAELVYLNRLDSLDECVVGGPKVVNLVTEAINSMAKGDEHNAFEDVVKSAVAISQEIKSCKSAPADIKALATWFITKAGSKQALVDNASANSLKHSQEME